MKKSILKVLLVAVLLFVATIPMLGCDEDLPIVWQHVSGDGNSWDIPVVMNAGEELVINKEHFSHIEFEFEEFEIQTRWTDDDNVIEIVNNTITAHYSGIVHIYASLFSSPTTLNGRRVRIGRSAPVGYIYVINEETMTHITTAQELADMNNNLDGHFILMADIDLGDFGEWTPIGRVIPIAEQPNWSATQRRRQGAFRGMFVNPHGYVIRNLTITTSEVMRDVGLFGFVYGDDTFIYGVVLEDISIDVSDFEEDRGGTTVGGIAGVVFGDVMIKNCVVSGTIIGGIQVGGIVGANSHGFIINSHFVGFIRVERDRNYTARYFAIGGIAGFNHFTRQGRVTANIINCTVVADLDGGEWADVGGIVGVTHNRYAIVNTSFKGTYSGRRAGTKIGWLNFPFDEGPINFE